MVEPVGGLIEEPGPCLESVNPGELKLATGLHPGSCLLFATTVFPFEKLQWAINSNATTGGSTSWALTCSLILLCYSAKSCFEGADLVCL